MRKFNRIISISKCLFAITFGLFLTIRLLADKDDSKAEKAIKKLGGKVVRTPAASGGPITGVDLARTKVTDTGLKELASLTSLHTLDLRFTKVTDAGLKEISGLQSLQNLKLGNMQVTDVGLREVASLVNLKELGLTNTKMTDVGLKYLAVLKQLRAFFGKHSGDGCGSEGPGKPQKPPGVESGRHQGDRRRT